MCVFVASERNVFWISSLIHRYFENYIRHELLQTEYLNTTNTSSKYSTYVLLALFLAMQNTSSKIWLENDREL